MSGRMKWFVGLAILMAVAPVRAQDESGKAPAKPAAQAAPKVPATDDPNYIIGAQDVLDINVWKEAELTRQVPVRPDGKISLPLLNDVQAAGMTPTQLAAKLTESLKKFVTNPQVTVIVSAINSQRFYIQGEVNRPGAYPIFPGMTILQALSSSGGFTQFAKQKSIYLLRDVDGKQTKLPFNYKDVINGKHLDQNLLLKPGDTVVVP